MPHPSPRLSRRRFLTAGGITAGAVLLGACGGDDDSGETTTTAAGGGLALAQFFGGPMFVAGQPLRAPFGVADAEGLLPVDRTPTGLSLSLLGPDGTALGEPVEVERRFDGLPRAYFPLTFTPDAPGIYTARTEVDGEVAEMSLKVDAAEDVTVIQIGDTMPPLETPTAVDARGVNPVCTDEPVCALHDATVAEVLAAGAPLALLVSTPAFCQIQICGPVLDVLLGVTADHPDVRFLHAEVYADPANGIDGPDAYAPVVADLGLHFEPCLVLVGSDGSVVDRLDTIFDRTEVLERLSRLA